MCLLCHNKLFIIDSITIRYNFRHIIKKIETSVTNFFEILPDFMTNQNFWRCALIELVLSAYWFKMLCIFWKSFSSRSQSQNLVDLTSLNQYRMWTTCLLHSVPKTIHTSFITKLHSGKKLISKHEVYVELEILIRSRIFISFLINTTCSFAFLSRYLMVHHPWRNWRWAEGRTALLAS